ELVYGAKRAWRNSNCCIGRAFWDSFTVNDARHIHTEQEFLDAIENHIQFTINGGKITPCITIFDGQHTPKIYSNQIYRYGCYEHVSDPFELKITQLAKHLGWQDKHTDFDILTLIYKIPGESLKFYNYQPEMIKEVPITHDRFPKLEKLGLK